MNEDLKKQYKEKVSPHTTSALKRLFDNGMNDFKITEKKTSEVENYANRIRDTKIFRMENEYLKLEFIIENEKNKNNECYNYFLTLNFNDKKRNLIFLKIFYDESYTYEINKSSQLLDINFLGLTKTKEKNCGIDINLLKSSKDLIEDLPFSEKTNKGIEKILLNAKVFFDIVDDQNLLNLMFFKQDLETQELYKLSNDSFIINEKNQKNEINKLKK